MKNVLLIIIIATLFYSCNKNLSCSCIDIRDGKEKAVLGCSDIEDCTDLEDEIYKNCKEI